MELECISRFALAAKGRALGFEPLVSMPAGWTSTYHHIAETVEAIIGAVYVDSQDEDSVAVAITTMGLVSRKLHTASGTLADCTTTS